VVLEAPGAIPSKKFSIWSRLYERFTLEPLPASTPPDVLKTIVPITSADDLLTRHKGLSEDTAVAGTGSVVLMTIPQGQRRLIKHLRATRASGTFTFNAFQYSDVSEGTTLTIDSFTTASTQIMAVLTAPIWLEEGDQIRAFVDVHSVAGNLTLEVSVEEEDAF